MLASMRVAGSMSAGGAKDVEFALFKNGSPVGSGSIIEFTGKDVTLSFPAVTDASEGDLFSIYVRNLSDTTDIVVSGMELILTRSS